MKVKIGQIQFNFSIGTRACQLPSPIRSLLTTIITVTNDLVYYNATATVILDILSNRAICNESPSWKRRRSGKIKIKQKSLGNVIQQTEVQGEVMIDRFEKREYI